jgi:transcriptional regulator with XRE-family HTH domain
MRPYARCLMAPDHSGKKSKSRASNRRAGERGRKIRLSSKKPNHIDEHVGRRLRLRRNLLGLSQDELARRLGVTSQLIQKYEAGETRISASRLYGIAGQLAIPITWFFDELDDKKRTSAKSEQTSRGHDWSELVTKRESRQLLELYFGIPDERLRRKVLEVAQLLKATDTE